MYDFSKSYNRENFKNFLINFLPGDFLYDEKNIKIKEDHKYFKNAKLLGSVDSLDKLAVMEIERFRPEKSRMSITKELFKLLEINNYANALVITYSKEESHYRSKNHN